ncbi:MAG: MBL fold metallo-hydrolase [Pseudomonadota bacterium]
MSIDVKFWGTRGSIPRPQSREQIETQIEAVLNAATPADIANRESVRAFIASGANESLPTIYGGNTACVQVSEPSGPSLLIDFGSGAREYAAEVMRTTGPVAAQPYHVLMSHFHWDHIMGFPFFMPAYIPGNVIHIYSCHDNVEECFRRQHGAPSFPVPFDVLGAEINFHIIEPDTDLEINGYKVRAHELNHAGRAFGFRVERAGTVTVYASDAEHKPEMISDGYPYVDFIRGADVLIFDAQYSLAEATSVKEDWGHSSNVVGVELALMGDVRHLVFFHHEPLNNDERLDQIVREARRIEEIMRRERAPLEVSGAYDGLVLTLG